ncbi:MAG: EamA family transporter [Nostoc sp.]|uniref:EamA family transporter n=1 Tax=Nostoc sp. TaxID=1180 RepID=UPI002FF4FA7C
MSWLAIALVLLSAAIHATWNLLAHSQKVNGAMFLRVSLIIGLFGFIPVVMGELRGDGFPLSVWGWALLTGFLQCFYYLGLTMGYRLGNFSVVYPIGRALPILFLALIDVSRGRVLSSLGWLGITLVIIGCMIAPLKSLRDIKLTDYWNQATVWILIIMFSTVAYTTVDKLAAELIPTGAGAAARYSVLQSIFTIPFLWVALKLTGEPIDKQKGLADWKWSTLFALFVFGSYWLMLWAFQLSPYISYLSAIRQFSIVIGVVVATIFFREPSPALRITATVAITLGMICITQVS